MIKNIFIVSLCVILIGCAVTPHVPNPNPLLQYGMSRDQLRAQMGLPDAKEIYEERDKTRVEFDIYNESSGFKIPVCLIKNKVVGWGKTYYEDHTASEDLVRIK